MRITKWSNSALTTLQQCGEKFRRRYIEREWTPSSPAAVGGSVVHKMARTSLLRKMEQQQLPSLEEVKDQAATEFRRSWGEGVKLTDEERGETPGAVEARTLDFAVGLSGFHLEHVAPVINPIGVERKIVVKPKDSDLEINGVIDLIDQQPEGEVIRDLKTSKKSPNKDAADKSQQLSMYALIRRAEVGTLPHSLKLDYLVQTPERQERKHVPLSTKRDEGDIVALVARINTATDAVERGVFMPTNPDSWWCSRQYCDYFETCPYVKRTARPTS
jgi:RecB family exonuclease